MGKSSVSWDDAITGATPEENGLSPGGDTHDELAAVSGLIIAFHRWCIRRGVDPPAIEDFRLMLAEATDLIGDDRR